jgi:predicted nucleotidyltransferase
VLDAAGGRVRTLRQWPTLEALVGQVTRMGPFLGALLIGSFARGTADEVSDLDLILVCDEAHFDEAWDRRRELHRETVLAAWDDDPARQCGAHRWLTHDLVLVECLIATPSSRARLAEPFVVTAGDPSSPTCSSGAPPVSRFDMTEAAIPSSALTTP